MSGLFILYSIKICWYTLHFGKLFHFETSHVSHLENSTFVKGTIPLSSGKSKYGEDPQPTMADATFSAILVFA